MDKLSMAIIAMEAHVACTNERLRQAWDVIYAELAGGQKPTPNTGSPKFIGLAELDKEMLLSYGVLSKSERLTMNRVYGIIANKLRAGA